jgi:hypothetical protein
MPGLNMAQRSGGVAYQRDILACGQERLDQLYRILVFGDIPHRTVTTRIEDGVIVFLLYSIQAHSFAELGLSVGILFKSTSDVGLEVRLVALEIEWRTTALRRREGNLGARILKNVVRRGKLLQPKAGLASIGNAGE